MGQLSQNPKSTFFIPENKFSDFLYDSKAKTLQHRHSSQRYMVRQYQFRSEKHILEDYYNKRKQLSTKTQQLTKLMDFWISTDHNPDSSDNNIKAQQNSLVSSYKNLTKNNNQINLCAMGMPTNNKAQTQRIVFVLEHPQFTLEDQIYNRAGKRSFQEIQIWSVLSSCVLGALNLLELDLKEPVLSPKAIRLSKQGIIKVGQWQFITDNANKEYFHQEGEVIIGQSMPSKDELSQILLGYYWPPEGIKAMEQITNLGKKTTMIKSHNRIDCPSSKLQIFSLGMTLISMCLRNCFYRLETFSQKYLNKLVTQAIQIRKVQGRPLSALMEKVLIETVKWQSEERISYGELRNIIIDYFSDKEDSGINSIQKLLDHSHQLSFSNISENISEQVSRNQISISKNSLSKFFFGQLIDENRKSILPLSNAPIKNSQANENSFGSMKMFEGSGTIDQGLGDDQQPEQEELRLQREKNKIKLDRNNNNNCLSSVRSSRSNNTNKLKNSVLSYKNSERFSQKQAEQIKGEAVDCIKNDIQDCVSEINFNFFQGSCQEEHPDIFEQIYEITTSEQNFQTDRALSQKDLIKCRQSPNFPQNYNPYRQYQNQHQSSIKFGFQISDSPINQNKVGSQCSFYSQQSLNGKKLKFCEDQIFTDPKLLNYIRTPIQSLESSYNKPQTQFKDKKYSKKQQPQFNSFGKQFAQSENKENCSSHFNDTPKNIKMKEVNNWIRVQCQSLANSDNALSSRTGGTRRLQSKENHRLVKEEMSKGYYQGQKKNGVRSGYGVFYYNQGGKYRGNWLNNKMHGKGKLEYADGRVAYQGDWYADQLHGSGVLYNQMPINVRQELDYQNLNNLDQYWVYYEGQFEHDDKSGKGMLVMTNGQHFSGTFKNDFAHGYGQYYKHNGETVKGYWEKNQLKTEFNS